MPGKFESSRPEDRPLANVGMVELLRHRRPAQVGADAAVRVRAHGAVRFETGVGAVLLRRRQRARSGGEDEGESDRGLDEHRRVSCLSCHPHRRGVWA